MSNFDLYTHIQNVIVQNESRNSAAIRLWGHVAVTMLSMTFLPIYEPVKLINILLWL